MVSEKIKVHIYTFFFLKKRFFYYTLELGWKFEILEFDFQIPTQSCGLESLV
jgi:hypothetical protein